LRDPISKNPITHIHTKGTGEVAQGVGPKFKPQFCKKKRKKEKEIVKMLSLATEELMEAFVLGESQN
jgi:glutamine amidotransferase-like uncharacterized protein